MKTAEIIRRAGKLAKPFRVVDSAKFRLKDIDPAETLEFGSEDKPRSKEVLAMGIDALAIPGALGATGMLMRFLPRLLSAFLILVVGWLAANFLGQATLIAAVNGGVVQARLLARATRWVVLLFAIATALTEIGIGRDMVLIAFGTLFGGIVAALALAFGLGGRHLAREILDSGRRREREPAGQDTITHL